MLWWSVPCGLVVQVASVEAAFGRIDILVNCAGGRDTRECKVVHEMDAAAVLLTGLTAPRMPAAPVSSDA